MEVPNYQLAALFYRSVELIRAISEVPEVFIENENKLRLYSLYIRYTLLHTIVYCCSYKQVLLVEDMGRTHVL